ncbi:MAG: LuxR C-terminal-related transcriptional regulator [Spongiibacteraceae bacterium]|nr:LuxR C-terminal-related transcriptional regulator [Spongiibacteraceae bacterium]
MSQHNHLLDYNNLVHSVYTGPKQNPPWAQFLESIKRQTGSDIAVIAFGSQTQKARINYVDGTAHTDYELPFLELSPFTRMPVGVVTTLEDFTDENNSMLSKFYGLCLKPMNVRHMIGINFYSNKDQFAYLRLGRTPAKSNYTNQEKDLFNLLYPHFHTVSELVTETHALHFQRDLFYEALERFGIGIVVTDSHLNVKGFNDKAIRIINNTKSFRLAGSKLHFTDQDIKKSIKRSLQTGWPDNTKKHLRITSTGEDIAFSIRPQHKSGAGWETHDICFYFSDATSHVNLSEHGLIEIYGLTKTEAKIARLLVNGLSVDEITIVQAVTKNTAYTHIKSILQKVGTSQQSTLVSKLIASPATLC